MNGMLVVNTIIRSLIVIICIFGIVFSLTLVLKFKRSIFAVMSAFLTCGFIIIASGKVLAIIGNFSSSMKVVSQVHEVIGFAGLFLMFIGLLVLLSNSKRKEKELSNNEY